MSHGSDDPTDLAEADLDQTYGTAAPTSGNTTSITRCPSVANGNDLAASAGEHARPDDPT